MSPTLTIIKDEKAPKKRGPQPGATYCKTVEHVCLCCGLHFMATAKAKYVNDAHRQRARKQRINAAKSDSD